MLWALIWLCWQWLRVSHDPFMFQGSRWRVAEVWLLLGDALRTCRRSYCCMMEQVLRVPSLWLQEEGGVLGQGWWEWLTLGLKDLICRKPFSEACWPTGDLVSAWYTQACRIRAWPGVRHTLCPGCFSWAEEAPSHQGFLGQSPCRLPLSRLRSSCGLC